MTTREKTSDHAELAACPFCGGTATIERFGNTRVSTQYQCDDCSCFLETGEEFHHGREWNRRPREAALLSEMAALRERLETARIAREAHNRQIAQAERQRDEAHQRYVDANEARIEAVGLLRRTDPFTSSLAVGAPELRADIRAFLANQGDDQ